MTNLISYAASRCVYNTYKIHKRKMCSRAQQLLFNIVTKGYNVSAVVNVLLTVPHSTSV
jgi:hypothetical protein